MVVVIGALGWFAFTKYQGNSARYSEHDTPKVSAPAASAFGVVDESSQSFSCDGRTYCSQMKSCAEATYFVRNCPGVEMDGDGDGVPCESQWCGGG
jgi:Excalibur calcium-binding domain